MRNWRVSLLLASALVAASAPFADPLPSRSGEAFLRSLFPKAGQPAHVRVYREQRAGDEPTFTTDHVSELWLARDGRFRFERCDLWGDAQLIINDGKRLVTDDLDGEPVAVRPGWKGLGAADELHGLLAGSLSVIHLLMLGEAAMEDLVEKDSEVKESVLSGKRVLTFKSGRLGNVRLQAAEVGKVWRVVEIEVEQDGTVTRDQISTLPLVEGDLFNTSIGKVR